MKLTLSDIKILEKFEFFNEILEHFKEQKKY